MIGQYLPDSGNVLDIGCGFGLFALAFARYKKDTKIQGFDLNGFRIATARRAAGALGIENVYFHEGDPATHQIEGTIDGAYMLASISIIFRRRRCALSWRLFTTGSRILGRGCW